MSHTGRTIKIATGSWSLARLKKKLVPIFGDSQIFECFPVFLYKIVPAAKVEVVPIEYECDEDAGVYIGNDEYFKMKTGFEYITFAVSVPVKVVDAPYEYANHGVEASKPLNLDAELNKFGGDGWELVSVVLATPSVSHSNGVCGVPLLIHYFRRLKT